MRNEGGNSHNSLSFFRTVETLVMMMGMELAEEGWTTAANQRRGVERSG